VVNALHEIERPGESTVSAPAHPASGELSSASSRAVKLQASTAGASGAWAVGAIAVGALAIGALAISRLAIRRLSIRRAHIGELEVDDLVIRRMRMADTGRRRWGRAEL
jgi:hypothetical protein